MVAMALKEDLGHELCHGSNRFLRAMSSVFAKYDREFPESDIVDLEDLSIVDNKGFVEKLPTEKTVWNSNLSEKSISSGINGKPDRSGSPKDLSVTALDLFLEEVISEERHHGDIGELDESSEKENNEDFSDDGASISSGKVSNSVVEDEEDSSIAESLDAAVRKIECFEESVDEKEKVRAWLKGKRKRETISADGNESSPSKARRSNVTKDIVKDVKNPQDSVGWGEDGVLKNDKLWRECVKNDVSAKKIALSPRRIDLSHDEGSSAEGADHFSLVTNVKSLESPVRSSTRQMSSHPESPSSGMLIESWKSRFSLSYHDDPTSDKPCYSPKQRRVARYSSSSQVPLTPDTFTSPRRGTGMHSNSLKCTRASQVSDKTRTEYERNDENEPDKRSVINTAKESEVHSVSNQYLQEFVNNLSKMQDVLDSGNCIYSKGESSGTEDVVTIDNRLKNRKGQLSNSERDRNLYHKGSSVSLEHTYILSGSDEKRSSCNGMDTQIRIEMHQSEPLNQSSGNLQNDKNVTCETKRSDTRYPSSPRGELRKKSLSVRDDRCTLKTLPGSKCNRSLLEYSFVEGEEDIPSSFVPCHSSTMIDSHPPVASYEQTQQAESKTPSKVIGKGNRLTPKRKYRPVKSLINGVGESEGVVTGIVRENSSPLFCEKKRYHCPTTLLPNMPDKTNSTERHSSKKVNLPNPTHSQKDIKKAEKTPANKGCGGPEKCRKVFCLECCHSPSV